MRMLSLEEQYDRSSVCRCHILLHQGGLDVGLRSND